QLSDLIPASRSKFQRRIHCRLESFWDLKPESKSEFLDVDLCTTPLIVMGIGGTAGLIHPSTGYMVARTMALAPILASVIAECLGSTRMIRGNQLHHRVWNGLWILDMKCTREYYSFGMETMLKLDSDGTRSVLQSCSSWEDFVLGICSWSQKMKLGFESNPVLGSALVDFYSKCGYFSEALEIFQATDCSDTEHENYIPASAIGGQPNVDKSSMLNALVGEDRTIVSPISGTRDAIETKLTGLNGQKFKLIDTAGIRRRAVVVLFGNITEALSVNQVLQAIRCVDVVDLVIEALACRIERDYKIAERIEREGKGCMTVVNKWDTIPNKKLQTASYYEEDVRERLRSLNWAPIVYSIA
ncbi:hypothetical protein IFM89_022291, partial [Coptis chinensis]